MTSDVYVPHGYVSLQNQGYVAGPPPYGHQAPRYHKKRGSKRCGCLRWCCCFCFSCCRCCICTLLILIILLVAIVVALYYLLKPNIPSYNFGSIDVKAFDIKNGNKLSTEFLLVVKADNPNEGIGLSYLENEIRVLYSDSQLCSGQFPPFVQPGKNTTSIDVDLKGESDFGPELQSQLMQNQKEGNIPLLIMVMLPIRLVIDDMIHLRRFVVYVNCSLVIDQLQPNKKPNILKKDFSYAVKF